jgi:Fe-S oxidoreductase
MTPCPRCGSALERHTGVIDYPVLTGYGNVERRQRLGAFDACTGCEYCVEAEPAPPASRLDAARAALLEQIGALSTAQIEACTLDLAGPRPEAERLVRAFLIEEYKSREGEAAADALMDRMGL